MEDIGQYLFNLRKHSLCYQHKVWDSWNGLKTYYGGEVPENVQEKFMAGTSKDLILENLQTHDWKTLAKKLEAWFGNNFLEADSKLEGEVDDRRTFFIRLKGTKEHPFGKLQSWVEEMLRKPEVKHDIEFFNYTFREIQDLHDSTIYVWFEPIFTESANDFIFGKCHGIVYHITFTEHLPAILEKGLRCKSNDDKWPSRIYFWAHEPQKFSQTKQDLKDFAMNELYPDTDVNWKNDLAVIRFRFWPGSGSRNGIPVYRDTAMDSHAFFTYTNIPKSDIDRVVKYPGQE